MSPLFYTVSNLAFFKLSDSELNYKIRMNKKGDYEIFVMTADSWELFGDITTTEYSFIISKRVQGLVLKKEIAFNEVK